MATSVAELAFLCLQQNKEMRPSMDFVLEELQRIKSGECMLDNLKEDDDKEELKSVQQQPPQSPPHCEESVLSKNIELPPSPSSVTENWVSNNTTPNINCNEQDGQKIQLGKDGPQFYITDIKLDYTLQLHDLEFEKPRQHGSCISLQNVTLQTSAYLSFNVPSNGTMLKCPSTHTNDIKNIESHQLCNDSTHSLVYNSSGFHPPNCSLIPLVVNKTPKSVKFLNLNTWLFYLRVNVTRKCYQCHRRGGKCQSDDMGNFHCSNATIGIKTKGVSTSITLLATTLSLLSLRSQFKTLLPSSTSTLEAPIDI
ncbi:hypothetical protein Dsin_028873 [Dipteronia sinensis]|uniref:Uncharacterized protein n=1 Tax=Dipteronia sinensis TaxID=43782 RepID=A0AAE0DVY8_9ROSI|nr:hypothetical protein Dsin_028873 [Dipteronia sinensis]